MTISNNALSLNSVLCITILLFISFISNAQPGNDNPSGAITITHANNISLTGSTSGATVPDIGVSQGTARANSVWYKFIATSNEVTLQINKISADDPSIRLFNNDFSFYVNRIRRTNTVSRLKYGNLTVGETYYIMVDNRQGYPGEFQLSIKDFIDNDFIEGAIDFTNELADGSHSSASGEFTTFPMTSDVYLTSDVWFKFTANAGSISIFAQGGTAKAMNIKLFDSNQNELKSQDYKNGTKSRLYYSELNSGEVYYFNISHSSNNGTFSLELSTTITNDHPIGAIQIPHTLDYNSGDAMLSNEGTVGMHNLTCYSGNGGDAWYKFTAASDLAELTAKTGGNYGSATALLITLLDSNLNEIMCSTPTNNTTTELNYQGLTIGETYYISITSHTSGQRGTFSLLLNSGVELCTWTCDESGNMYYSGGKIGIGTSDIPENYSLAVNGHAIMEEIVVQLKQEWPDYVFDPSYKLPSLLETKKFIVENKHLKGIPSAAEVEEKGISLGEMNAKLLEKIEELTLYQIQMMELLQKQQLEINELKSKKSSN